MNEADARRECPAMPALVDWFEGALNPDAADRIEQHLDRCGCCRQSLLRWSERIGAVALGAISGECPDVETLVAYSAAALDATAATEVERHLRRCARCVPALQHIMVLQRQMQPEVGVQSSATLPAWKLVFAHISVFLTRAARRGRTAGESNSPAESWEKSSKDDSRQTVGVGLSRLGSAGKRPRSEAGDVGHDPHWAKGELPFWWTRLRELLMPPAWPRAALAAAAVLVLAIGITRFIQPTGRSQEMRARSGGQIETVEITADTAGRARPALDEPVVLRVTRGTQARWLETSGEWTRIELADGRRVWVEKQSVTQSRSE
jgi:hypothetical protein